MRGKAIEKRLAAVETGITPAYAGKSGYYSTAGSSGKDHPRVCGEKIWDVAHLSMREGSPPRMRGKVLQFIIGHAVEGITPAYAGKSCSSTGRAGGRGDHPRVCGEEAYCFVVCRCSVGSPPRMRGRALLHCTVQT